MFDGKEYWKKRIPGSGQGKGQTISPLCGIASKAPIENAAAGKSKGRERSRIDFLFWARLLDSRQRCMNPD
ncbi:MAG TPA: hypothetical protein VJ960_01140 [Oceanipulchritudo sp.]|jgi:hypothetical protein|nr:hypothetical protein [Oceanipulchritudo sp.]